MDYFDNIGNKIEIGDKVLILVPKTDKTYRQGIIKDFRNPWSRDWGHFHCEILVEYDDGRLYCNQYRWDRQDNTPIKFTKKVTKAWRSNSDVIKFKSEYVE